VTVPSKEEKWKSDINAGQKEPRRNQLEEEEHRSRMRGGRGDMLTIMVKWNGILERREGMGVKTGKRK